MKIYIGNLSQQITEQDLHQAFEAFGEIRFVNIIKARPSGESLGYGFVIMPNWREATDAIGAMEGRELMGKTIKVEKGLKRGWVHKRRYTGARGHGRFGMQKRRNSRA